MKRHWTERRIIRWAVWATVGLNLAAALLGLLRKL